MPPPQAHTDTPAAPARAWCRRPAPPPSPRPPPPPPGPGSWSKPIIIKSLPFLSSRITASALLPPPCLPCRPTPRASPAPLPLRCAVRCRPACLPRRGVLAGGRRCMCEAPACSPHAPTPTCRPSTASRALPDQVTATTTSATRPWCSGGRRQRQPSCWLHASRAAPILAVRGVGRWAGVLAPSVLLTPHQRRTPFLLVCRWYSGDAVGILTATSKGHMVRGIALVSVLSSNQPSGGPYKCLE